MKYSNKIYCVTDIQEQEALDFIKKRIAIKIQNKPGVNNPTVILWHPTHQVMASDIVVFALGTNKKQLGIMTADSSKGYYPAWAKLVYDLDTDTLWEYDLINPNPEEDYPPAYWVIHFKPSSFLCSTPEEIRPHIQKALEVLWLEAQYNTKEHTIKVNPYISGFEIQRLVNQLTQLGYDIDIIFKSKITKYASAKIGIQLMDA